MKLSKEVLILLVLRSSPMKYRLIESALFFIWRRLGSEVEWPFTFRPLGFGPVPNECGHSLACLSDKNLVARATSQWGSGTSRLTDDGKREADKIASTIDTLLLATIEGVVLETAKLTKPQLVSRLVSEGPEFFNPPLAPLIPSCNQDDINV
ncbi:MAG: hypothetical protein WC749_12380 [Dehalococcoidia bacterium]